MNAPSPETQTGQSTTAHIYEAGGSDPDFYLPPTQARHGQGGLLNTLRGLPSRLARATRG